MTSMMAGQHYNSSSSASSLSSELWSGKLRCSYKRATFLLCAGNLVVGIFMLCAALAPLYSESSSPAPVYVLIPAGERVEPEVPSTQEELERIEASNKLRRELLPVQLIERVKEIQAETEAEINRTASLKEARQKVAAELSQRLRELKLSNSQSKQDDGLNILSSGSQLRGDEVATDGRDDGEYLLKRLDTEHKRKPLPPECHAEGHTDYGGAAVRWGLSHHVATAADCCQACLDQAKDAKDGEKKCNIWVYCPDEGGCHSPDKYIHENHECWLKQADLPTVTFKDRYDDNYRENHPTAPLIVPWVSGVVS